MRAGDTFLRKDNDKHLWLVLSDPEINPEKVLLVNLTSYDSRKDRACLLNSGDHPWIRKPTCVNYADAVITSDALLSAAKAGGAVELQEPLSRALLKRIRDAAMESERMILDHAEILISQGLVDC